MPASIIIVSHTYLWISNIYSIVYLQLGTVLGTVDTMAEVTDPDPALMEFMM